MKKRRHRENIKIFTAILLAFLVLSGIGAAVMLRLGTGSMGAGDGWAAVGRPVSEDGRLEEDASEASFVGDTSWMLCLVNQWNPIGDRQEIKLAEVEGGQQVDERIYPALTELLDGCREAGYEPIVVSGYRTEEKQQSLMDEKIKEYQEEGYGKEEAEELALQWVASPGTSEHELGLAVDINGDVYDIYPWLEENSYRYGFIYRYPPDKTDITGVSNEPWHFRYVGKQAAKEIFDQGICLEEYKAYLG